MNTKEFAIRLEHVTAGYHGRVLLEDVSTRVARGRLVAMIGRNGSGKSTLLRILAALGKPISGDVYINNVSVQTMTPRQRASAVSLVTTERVRIPTMPCSDVVALGRAPYTNWIGHLDANDRRIVDEALALTGMTDYASRPIDTLSDGEAQRIMIARAIAQDTPVMLLDEPTSFLDLPSRHHLVSLLRDIVNTGGKTILFSTHELDIALHYCDEIMLLDTPQLIHLPASEMAESAHLQRLFDFN